jgi:hypothetical protein
VGAQGFGQDFSKKRICKIFMTYSWDLVDAVKEARVKVTKVDKVATYIVRLQPRAVARARPE